MTAQVTEGRTAAQEQERTRGDAEPSGGPKPSHHGLVPGQCLEVRSGRSNPSTLGSSPRWKSTRSRWTEEATDES